MKTNEQLEIVNRCNKFIEALILKKELPSDKEIAKLYQLMEERDNYALGGRSDPHISIGFEWGMNMMRYIIERKSEIETNYNGTV